MFVSHYMLKFLLLRDKFKQNIIIERSKSLNMIKLNYNYE